MKYPSDEFDAALSAVCDGTVADAQSRALAALLREDAAARDAYLFAVELHARLASDNALFFAPRTEDRVEAIPFPATRTVTGSPSGLMKRHSSPNG